MLLANMSADGADNDHLEEEDEMIIISADRSEEEKRAAYAVEWREPANKPSLADRIRSLF